MLRFCAYALGREELSVGVGEVARRVVLEEEEEEEGRAPGGYHELMELLRGEREEREKEGGERVNLGIQWRGQDIPVRNVELVEVVQKVKDALRTLEGDSLVKGEGKKGKAKKVLSAKRMGTYDRVLLVLSDAEAVASQLVEDNKVRFLLLSRPSLEQNLTNLTLLLRLPPPEVTQLESKRRLALSNSPTRTSSINSSWSAQSAISSLSNRPKPNSRPGKRRLRKQNNSTSLVREPRIRSRRNSKSTSNERGSTLVWSKFTTASSYLWSK